MEIMKKEDISGLYAGEYVPVLDADTLRSVTDYFRIHGYGMQEGALSADRSPRTSDVLHLTHKFESLGSRALIMGPYIMNGRYYPNGIGGWGNTEEK